jgi:hypothetical protein
LLVQSIVLQTNTLWLSNTLWFIQHLLNLALEGYQEPQPPPVPVASIPLIGADSDKRAFFGELNLSPLSICISFQTGVRGTDERKTDYDWILKTIASYPLDGAPIRLNALMFTNALMTYDDLFNIIIMHYIKAGASQVNGSNLYSSNRWPCSWAKFWVRLRYWAILCSWPRL